MSMSDIEDLWERSFLQIHTRTQLWYWIDLYTKAYRYSWYYNSKGEDLSNYVHKRYGKSVGKVVSACAHQD